MDPQAPTEEDIPVKMERLDLAGIPMLAFPEGFGIRSLLPGEGALWRDIQRDTERLFAIEDDLFERQFGSDPEAQAHRCFFMTNERGAAVGTISAWYSRDEAGVDWGQVHWFAIRPAYQGRGLARPALAHALHMLAQWHDRAWLGTSSQRLPALKLYLDFGFVPRRDTPRAEEAWAQVRARLPHPALGAS